MTIEVASPELFEYESTKSVFLVFVKPEKCSLFLSHSFPYAFIFFCLLLSSKAAPQLALPLLCCRPLTFLQWRSLSTEHISCFYALSLLMLYSFSSQTFSSSPSHLYYWLYSCSRSPKIAPKSLSQIAHIQLQSLCPISTAFEAMVPSAMLPARSVIWISLPLGWKKGSGEIKSTYFPLSHSLFFRAATMSSKKLNKMQIWWKVLFLEYIYNSDLRVESRRGMPNSICGIILRSLNTKVRKPVPWLHFLGSVSENQTIQ